MCLLILQFYVQLVYDAGWFELKLVEFDYLWQKCTVRRPIRTIHHISLELVSVIRLIRYFVQRYSTSVPIFYTTQSVFPNTTASACHTPYLFINFDTPSTQQIWGDQTWASSNSFPVHVFSFILKILIHVYFIDNKKEKIHKTSVFTCKFHEPRIFCLANDIFLSTYL